MSAGMNVPSLRFSEFGGEWEEKKLGKLAVKITSGSRDWAKYYSESGSKFIRMTNLSRGGIALNLDELKYVNVQSNSSDGQRTSLQFGDILISITAELGKLGWVPEGLGEAYINQHTALVRLNSEQVDSKLVAYLLSSSKMNKVINRLNDSGAKSGLNLSTLHSLRLSLPSTKEQQKIADFLTAVDKRIEQLEEKKRLLSEYKKGVMQQIFSQQIRFKDENGNSYPDWQEKRLGDVASIYDGTHLTPKYVEIGIPFYSVEHLTRNNFEHTKYISEDVYNKENKRVKLERGDILMTKIGDIGTAKYLSWDVKASFYVSLALIKQSMGFNSQFLAQYISGNQFQHELYKRTIHVAFPKKINLGEISNCLGNFPVFDEQQKIASFLTSIDNKIEQVGAQLEQAKTFKKGLLQQMFV